MIGLHIVMIIGIIFAWLVVGVGCVDRSHLPKVWAGTRFVQYVLIFCVGHAIVCTVCRCVVVPFMIKAVDQHHYEYDISRNSA